MKFNVLVSSLILLGILQATVVQAKVWRVNNTTGVAADFKEVSTAIANALVVNGDTLYVEGTATSYATATLNKKIVIIGSGYLLSGTGANTGLQAMGQSTKISILNIDSLGTGSTIMGVSTQFYLNSNVDDITITRCEGYIGRYNTYPNSKIVNLTINKYIGYIDMVNYTLENPRITNCILTNVVVLNTIINGLIRNNVFTTQVTLANSYITNNIFLSTTNITSSTIKYNIAVTNVLPAGNGNQNNVSSTVLFVGTGSGDGRYMLKAGSPAIGAGEPINGETPDVGAFGTADPYRLSGIPPIPSIYMLTVPGSVPAAATSMDITFSTRSNN
ncbi:MAG: hypothetical protein J7621_21550 [Niastella sp.]|nr:hypothetical protein [Niastella sp.]